MVIVFGGFTLSGILRYALPDFEIPQPTGKYSVGVTEYTWTSGVRVKIWYPASVGSEAKEYGYLADFNQPVMGLPPIVYSHLKGRKTFSYQDTPPIEDIFPVIIYEHGAGGYAEDNTFLLTDLASHGFVVISVIHQNTLTEYNLDLEGLSATPEKFLAVLKDTMMPDRIKELTLVVNGLKTLSQRETLLQGRLDLDRISFVGYSLGGGIVTDYCATHPTCQAVVNLDGNPFTSAHQTGLTAPYLHISQNALLILAEDDDPMSATAQMGNLYKREVRQVVENTINNGYTADWLLLNNSGHGSFTDLSYWVAIRWGMLQSILGTVDTESSQEAIRTITREFLQNPASTESVRNRYQELFSRFPD